MVRLFNHSLVAGECFVDQRADVEHERDALVAELGRASEPLRPAEGASECLDDDVLLPDEAVDDEPELAVADRRDDDEPVRRRRRCGRRARTLVRDCRSGA